MGKSLAEKRKAVFTNVLVVLAVLAIIVLVFPFTTCGCAPGKARIITCESYERQIGLAIIQYEQDNDQQFPPGQHDTGMGWAGQVYPYVKRRDVFVCPDDHTRPADNISYGFNSNLAALTGTRKMAANSLPSPASTVMVFEISHDQADITQRDEGAAQGATTFSAAGNGLTGGLHSRPKGADPVWYARARHAGLSNYLFADGHVRAWPFKGSVVPGTPGSGTGAPTFRIK